LGRSAARFHGARSAEERRQSGWQLEWRERGTMSENVILEKSCRFALRIVRLYKFLSEEKKEFVLSKQALIAGTYVGAHVKAAQEGESKTVFVHEMSAALQKASQAQYWLQLLR